MRAFWKQLRGSWTFWWVNTLAAGTGLSLRREPLAVAGYALALALGVVFISVIMVVLDSRR